jgi:hypothetical protein
MEKFFATLERGIGRAGLPVGVGVGVGGGLAAAAAAGKISISPAAAVGGGLAAAAVVEAVRFFGCDSEEVLRQKMLAQGGESLILAHTEAMAAAMRLTAEEAAKVSQMEERFQAETASFNSTMEAEIARLKSAFEAQGRMTADLVLENKSLKLLIQKQEAAVAEAVAAAEQAKATATAPAPAVAAAPATTATPIRKAKTA